MARKPCTTVSTPCPTTSSWWTRKLLKNPNGLIREHRAAARLFAKREIANCFLLTTDDVIICDPEAEYAPLVERLHGQVIKISPTSTNYINPLDINLTTRTMKVRCPSSPTSSCPFVRADRGRQGGLAAGAENHH